MILSGDRFSAALLCLCYLAFLVVAARLQVNGQHESCGCFGASTQLSHVSPVAVASERGSDASKLGNVRASAPSGMSQRGNAETLSIELR